MGMFWVFTVLVLDAIKSLLGAMMLIGLVRLILILVLWTGCKFGCSVWWLVLCILLIFAVVWERVVGRWGEIWLIFSTVEQGKGSGGWGWGGGRG